MTAFEEIYREHFGGVYRYVYSLCRDASAAEEITQETFFKALRSIDRFDGKCSVFVWLCQIAKNTYFTHYRKEKRFEAENAPEESRSNIELEFVTRESAFEVHRILHKLEEPYKEVFSLRTFGELSFAQIGELFGKTESWARVTYHRAKLKIKERLQ